MNTLGFELRFRVDVNAGIYLRRRRRHGVYDEVGRRGTCGFGEREAERGMGDQLVKGGVRNEEAWKESGPMTKHAEGPRRKAHSARRESVQSLLQRLFSSQKVYPRQMRVSEAFAMPQTRYESFLTSPFPATPLPSHAISPKSSMAERAPIKDIVFWLQDWFRIPGHPKAPIRKLDRSCKSIVWLYAYRKAKLMIEVFNRWEWVVPDHGTFECRLRFRH